MQEAYDTPTPRSGRLELQTWRHSRERMTDDLISSSRHRYVRCAAYGAVNPIPMTFDFID
jgi:hypothetical protein